MVADVVHATRFSEMMAALMMAASQNGTVVAINETRADTMAAMPGMDDAAEGRGLPT